MIAGLPKSVWIGYFRLRSRTCCYAGYFSSGISVFPSLLNPKFPRHVLLGWLLSFLMLVLCVGAMEANAKESGKDGLHAKLDTFTVNLAGPTQRYLQVDITLSLANAEVGERVKAYMPVIRHKMILLLTNKEASQLGTTDGKRKLVLEAKSAANNAIKVMEGEGVTDVLFTSFIIQ